MNAKNYFNLSNLEDTKSTIFLTKIGKKWAIILTEVVFWENEHHWKIAF